MNKKRMLGYLAVSFLLGAGACAGIMVLFVGGIWTTTKPVVDASDEFLNLLGQGRTSEAYGLTSGSFRSTQTKTSFAIQSREAGLQDYQSSIWSRKSVVKNEGVVEGQIKSKNGDSSAAEIRLVNEDGIWKVALLRVSGIEIPAKPLPLPKGEELQKMIKEPLLELNRAAKTHDFALLYAQAADLLKEKFSLKEFANEFEGNEEHFGDIGEIAKLQPKQIITSKRSEDDIFFVKGTFKNDSLDIDFKVEYFQEKQVWKLVGISVKRYKH